MSDSQMMRALAELVPVGSRVLDLGCGDGALLELLQKERACSGYGVELDHVHAALHAGLHVGVVQLHAVACASVVGL